MATITIPAATRAIAVQPRQPIPMTADVSSDWYQRNQTSGGATGPWTLITTAATSLVWETSATVTRRLLYDRLQVAVVDTGAAAPATGFTGGLHLNLCEGPPTVQWVTANMPNAALEEPPMTPWEGESDDPPLNLPLYMPGANRDGMGTELLETASDGSGPSNLVASFDRGLFVDMAGKLGCRVAFTNDVRGFGPFPAIASYHHGGLYFQHDFGKSRTLGLTRVLYEDGSNLDVSIVRGDGRRNTYRWNGASFDAAASLQNTLTKAGGIFTETTPSGRIYRYTSAGLLDRVVDRAGNPVYYQYDANSRLQKIVGVNSSQLGLVPYLSYNGSGLLERLVLEDSTTPANNRASYFQYDASRNLTRIIGPEACITYFGYNGAGTLLTSVTDPEGYVWRAEHDGNDRCDRVVDALGKYTYFAYDTAAPWVRNRDRVGKVTYFVPNAFGSPDRVYNPGDLADYYAYDGEGNMTQARNRLNRAWYYQYDGRSNRISATDPLGARSYFAFDAQDLLRTYVDPINRASYLTYDAQRSVQLIYDPSGTQKTYNTDATGVRNSIKDRTGQYTIFGHDQRANFVSVKDPNGSATYFAFNTGNERTAQVDPVGRVTYFERDLRGRVVKATDPIGAATYFAFDARCNLVSQKNALQRTTTHQYDGNSSLIKTVDPLGDATYFEYDDEQRQKGQRDARLFLTYWTFDVLGRRQRQVDALGGVTYFAYTGAHETYFQTDALGHPTYFLYDPAGRLIVQGDALANVTYFGHDLAGQRVLTVDPRSFPTYYEYDPRGWLQQAKTAIGATTSREFDGEGRTLTSIDPRGLATYYTYDRGGRLTHTKDQAAGVTYQGYDAASQTVLRLDQLGSPTYLGYDLAGRQQTTLDRGGLWTYFQYDPVGNVLAQTLDQGWGLAPWGSSPYGGQRATTYHTYDAANRRQKTTDAYGGQTYVAYDRVGNAYFTVDARGFPAYFTYDALNRRTIAKDAYGATTTTAYDAVGNVVRTADQQGRTTYFGFDLLNRAYFQVDPAGALTYHAYDASSNRTATHVQLGPAGTRRSTYLQYDPVNRVVKQIAADGGQTYHIFDLVGNRTRVIDPVGRSTYWSYDTLNRPFRQANAFNQKALTFYDARSSVTTKVDPAERATYLGYDPAARLRSQSNALGEFSYFFYDARGARTQVLNPRGHSTYMHYDLLGRQTHTIDALGGVSYMGHDAAGNQVLAVDQLGRGTYYTYDRLNRQTHVKDQANAVTYVGYDDRSSVVLRQDADGRATYMTYDVAQRVASQHFKNPVAGEAANAPSYYVYDQVSNLRIVDDRLSSLGVSYYDYDLVDRLAKKVTLAGAVYYAYDLSGMQTSLKDPGLVENVYVLDAAGRLTALQVAAGRTAYYAYDASGLATHRLLPGNDVQAYMAYDAAGRLSSLTNLNPVNGVLSSNVYVRNQNGAITAISQQFGQYTYYAYDALDRLTRDFVHDGFSTARDNYYTYDAASNRTTKSSRAAPLSETYYTYNTLNLLTDEKELGSESTYYEYDLTQRMTRQRSSAEATYFGHDQRDQINMVKHKAASSDPIQYFTYSGVGERVRAAAGATEAYWAHDGSNLLREQLSTGTTARRYRHNWSPVRGGIVELESTDIPVAGGRVYPAYNEDGSVMQLATSGDIPESYTYDRFGVTTDSGATGQRARYVSDGLIALATTQDIYLTPGGGCYLPGPGRTTIEPSPSRGGPIEWGHGGATIFGFVPTRGPWIPVRPIPVPVPTRPSRGGRGDVLIVEGRGQGTGVMWQDAGSSSPSCPRGSKDVSGEYRRVISKPSIWTPLHRLIPMEWGNLVTENLYIPLPLIDFAAWSVYLTGLDAAFWAKYVEFTECGAFACPPPCRCVVHVQNTTTHVFVRHGGLKDYLESVVGVPLPGLPRPPIDFQYFWAELVVRYLATLKCEP